MLHQKTLTALALGVILCSSLHAQFDWSVTGAPRSGRYDDIFFINDSVGWAAGADRQILCTKDGGASWQLQFTAPGKYLRSIEFATDRLGFCGSLDSTLYKTEDGGLTWIDITSDIHPRPPGICGLAAPDSLHIYGCGVYRSPAFIIKSSDGGRNWTYMDMSAYASRLVDIYFINKDTGFATGTANPETDGGIILYTANGGATWQVVFKTLVNDDFVWKIQTPDNMHFFGSVHSLPGTSSRILRSDNGGLKWTAIEVTASYSNLEMVGFVDRMTGWTGGRDALYKTTDGGATWTTNLTNYNVGFNRFFRVNASTVFLSGYLIYKKKGGPEPRPDNSLAGYNIRVTPNPANGPAKIILEVGWSTFANVSLYNANGTKLRNYLHAHVPAGTRTFDLDLTAYPAGTYFLVLRTNEGMTHCEVVKQ